MAVVACLVGSEAPGYLRWPHSLEGLLIHVPHSPAASPVALPQRKAAPLSGTSSPPNGARLVDDDALYFSVRYLIHDDGDQTRPMDMDGLGVTTDLDQIVY